MPTRPAARRWLTGALLGGLVLLAAPLAGPSAAQGPPDPAATQVVALSGRVAHPVRWNLARLRASPSISVQITRATPDGVRTNRYTGALLWTLVSQAGLSHEAGPHSYLRQTLMAQGRDGYTVALAIAELDPDFEGKQVLIAYEQDGKPLPELRLVVPADVKAGRSVRDLVAIDVH